eukprot:2391319-Pyramimonas_sp.AAC.1
MSQKQQSRELRQELFGDDFQRAPSSWEYLSVHDQVLYTYGVMSHPGDIFPAPTRSEPIFHHAYDPERDDYQFQR